jgi:hypothetical protein
MRLVGEIAALLAAVRVHRANLERMLAWILGKTLLHSMQQARKIWFNFEENEEV